MAKGFTVEEETETPTPEWTRHVSKILDQLDCKSKLRELVLFERLYGWAALGLSYKDNAEGPGEPVLNPAEIVSLTVFSDHNCTILDSDVERSEENERCGQPNKYTVSFGVNATQKKIHHSRMIHFASRKIGHAWRGVSALEILYSDLTAYRNAREQVVHALKTHAAGFADIKLNGNKNINQLNDFKNQHLLDNLDGRSYFLHDKNSRIEWIGAKGKALDPSAYMDVSLESLSCGSRIPVSHLRGATAGTLAGSEVNDREYWGAIAMQQSLLEQVIWELIDKLIETNQIQKVEDYNLVWPSGFEISDQTAAEIELKKAQAKKIQLSWKSIDEIRAEEGLDPLPEGTGQKIVEESQGFLNRFRGWLKRNNQPEGEKQ
jgi:hypothetical protein